MEGVLPVSSFGLSQSGIWEELSVNGWAFPISFVAAKGSSLAVVGGTYDVRGSFSVLSVS